MEHQNYEVSPSYSSCLNEECFDIEQPLCHNPYQVLQTNANIPIVELVWTNCTADAATLSELIARNTTVHWLAIKHPYTSNDNLAVLADGLIRNTTICKLDFYNQDLYDDQIRAIMPIIRGKTSLRTLDISHNYFGPDGIRYLVDALQANPSISRLKLFWNPSIGPNGAQILADFLRTNTSIREIFLEGCRIGIEGVRSLTEALKHNTTIEYISVASADFRFSARGRDEKRLTDSDKDRRIVIS
jgi:hypothetical protein